ELIGQEQRVIARAAEMTVVGAALPLAVRGALTRIHVEHDELWRPLPVHAIDPLAGKIGDRGDVLRTSEPFRLETSYLARGRRSFVNRSIANDPPHRRVTAQAISVVHVLVAGEPSKHRLPQQSDKYMPTIPAG